MYHNTYPASWFVSNQVPKTPFLFTYRDVPLFTVDHVHSAFVPFPQQPLYASSPIALNVPNMKRIPVNTLIQSVEAVNSYLPFLKRRNIGQPTLDRQFSKESLIESAHGDSGVSSSRSSTPSSIETSNSSESKNTLVYPVLSFKNAQNRNLNQCKSQTHQSKKYQSNPKYKQPNVKHWGMQSKVIPQVVNDEWKKVTNDIWDHYIKNRQKPDMHLKKMKLRAAVHALLVQHFPNCGLRVVGSSVNGLGTNSSDADMCLILSPREIDQQTEAMHLLLYIQQLLNQCYFVKSTNLINAKVPILKFTDKYDNIQVDLNINNTVGIANTQLLEAYCKVDWRVPSLVLIIKKWAQECEINNAKEMTLSSYSLVLMVIHYFQCGCDPPVLPCLQRMQPNRYEGGGEEDYWKWLIPYGEPINFQSTNAQSLGSLLFGFFDYYTNKFDFAKDVISIRLGCKIPKHVAMNYSSTKNKRGHWKFVCIEEPFNRTNTACAVYDQDSFNRIVSAFKITYMCLSDRKELSAIFSS